MKINLVVFVCFLGICFECQQVDGLSCKDEDGNAVDWYYLYKLPRNFKHKSSTGDRSGLSYMFATSKQYSAWIFSKNKISDTKSLLHRTLNNVLLNQTLFTIGYNDQFPNGTVLSSGGHAKGVVATNGKQGIWLIHSVPKFPTFGAFSYPSSGGQYGQSFLCMSLAASEMNKVGNLLTYSEVNVYHSYIPSELKGKFPALEESLNRKSFKSRPNKVIVDLTVGNKKFRAFAKNHHFDGDLYEDFVAPTLDANLLVESWRNGGGNLATNCSQNDKVFNIEEIKSENLDVSFKTSADHSKWAVTEGGGIKLWRWRIGSSDWICIGDLNRQNHQKERGGGTVCQKHSKVTHLYRDLIQSFEPCPMNPRKK